MMKDIEDRKDLSKLIHRFYRFIRTDDLLGPIFNGQIQEDHWPAHLEKLTDFWETILFRSMNFKGNPSFAHRTVDENFNHTIGKHHFEKWISLWHHTIDLLFFGPVANTAKQASENMAIGQFNVIMNGRSLK